MAVADLIAELKLDVPSVVGALLHDTVEDTLATLEEIKSLFGREIAALVDGVTKLSRANFSSQEEKQAENFPQDAARHGQGRAGDTHQTRRPGA
jgi:GTP pyrophosphokinase